MKILIVEDERRVGRFIERALQEQSYTARLVETCASARDALADSPYDAIVLDLLLPYMGGMELLAQIRAQGCTVPVLILSARDGVADRVDGLNTGADDYLVKPFRFEELVARLRALLRRGKTDQPMLRIADLTMDIASRRVQRGGQSIALTPKEFALLEYLLRHRDTVLTRTMIAEHVWDQNFDSFSNVIDVYIRYLRTKIDSDFEVKLIQTVRGVGYVLSETQE
jgi:DNA-binding response OmpR family regulator